MATQSELFDKLASSCKVFSGDEQRFQRLLRQRVRPLLDFTLAAAAIGPCVASGCPISRIVGIDTTPGLLRGLRLAGRLVADRIFQRAPTLSGATIFEPSDPPRSGNRSCFRFIRSQRTAFLWYVDAPNRLRSYFILAGLSVDSDQNAAVILSAIGPLLHSALLQVEREMLGSFLRFSRAEKEIIFHLLQYRSNKEIAKLLGKSDATVRNQLHAIYGKIDVKTRTAAVGLLQREFAMNGEPRFGVGSRRPA